MSPIKTLIIVESPNDEAFIRLLLQNLQLVAVEVDSIDTIGIEHLHKIEGTNLRGKSALAEKIDLIKADLRFSKFRWVEHIAIILDSDSPPDGGIQKSIDLVNKGIGSKLGFYPDIVNEADPRKITIDLGGEIISIAVSCFFIKLETGEGHLDLVLKAIASKSSDVDFCHCLETQLLPCMKAKGNTLNDYEKLWVNHYLRNFASKRQISDAEMRLHEVISERGPEIFDLEHPLLTDLKSYLKLIST